MQSPLEIAKEIASSAPVKVRCRSVGEERSECYSLKWEGNGAALSAKSPLAAAYGSGFLKLALEKSLLQGLPGSYSPRFSLRLLLPENGAEVSEKELIAAGYNGAFLRGDAAPLSFGLRTFDSALLEQTVRPGPEQTRLDALLEKSGEQSCLFLSVASQKAAARQLPWLPELLNKTACPLLFPAFVEGRPHPLFSLLRQNPEPSRAPLIPLLDLTESLEPLRFLQEQARFHHYLGAACRADPALPVGHALFTALPLFF